MVERTCIGQDTVFKTRCSKTRCSKTRCSKRTQNLRCFKGMIAPLHTIAATSSGKRPSTLRAKRGASISGDRRDTVTQSGSQGAEGGKVANGFFYDVDEFIGAGGGEILQAKIAHHWLTPARLIAARSGKRDHRAPPDPEPGVERGGMAAAIESVEPQIDAMVDLQVFFVRGCRGTNSMRSGARRLPATSKAVAAHDVAGCHRGPEATYEMREGRGEFSPTTAAPAASLTLQKLLRQPKVMKPFAKGRRKTVDREYRVHRADRSTKNVSGRRTVSSVYQASLTPAGGGGSAGVRIGDAVVDRQLRPVLPG